MVPAAALRPAETLAAPRVPGALLFPLTVEEGSGELTTSCGGL